MRRPGLTLLELLIVLFILAALAGLVLPMVGGYLTGARETTTQASLGGCRDAVVQYWSDNKLELDTLLTEAERRLQLSDLFENPGLNPYDPTLKLGWNGPYLSEPTGRYSVDVTRGYLSDYDLSGAPAMLDAWGRPLVIQDVDPTVLVGIAREVRIVSAGPDGVIDLPPATLAENLDPADQGDDIYVSLTLR